MRTGTGVVEEVCPNGLAKIQTNRNNLYSPCSDSMCADNVVIDAVNPIGAKKGQYVQFNIPDAGMGVKGIICFGVPLLLIIVCGVAGYLLGESWQVVAGPQEQVVRIAENDLGAHIVEFFRRQRLDRRLRADRHEHGRLEGAVRRAQYPGAGAVTFGLLFVGNDHIAFLP